MPYQSDAQRRFMHARHPGIARRWDKEHPANAKSTKLPERVGKQTRQPRGQGGGGQWAGYVASPMVKETRRA